MPLRRIHTAAKAAKQNSKLFASVKDIYNSSNYEAVTDKAKNNKSIAPPDSVLGRREAWRRRDYRVLKRN